MKTPRLENVGTENDDMSMKQKLFQASKVNRITPSDKIASKQDVVKQSIFADSEGLKESINSNQDSNGVKLPEFKKADGAFTDEHPYEKLKESNNMISERGHQVPYAEHPKSINMMRSNK